MSQFIDLPRTVPLQSPIILKGIMSKVIQAAGASRHSSFNKRFSSTSMTNLSTQNYKTFYQLEQDKRFVQELKLADQLQNVVIGQEYEKMKRNLVKYGKSMSLKIENIVRQKHESRYFDSVQGPNDLATQSQSRLKSTPKQSPVDIVAIIAREQKQAKQRYSIGNIHSQISSHDRTVFIDRKYNNEFSIKYSSLKQAQEIKEMKDGYKQFLAGYKTKSPLVQQANGEIRRQKYRSEYSKEPMTTIGVVNCVEGGRYRPRRKQRSLQETLVMKENIEEMEQVLTRACSGKLKFAGLGNVKRFEKNQSGVKRHANEGKSMRKKQKKINWEKVALKIGKVA